MSNTDRMRQCMEELGLDSEPLSSMRPLYRMLRDLTPSITGLHNARLAALESDSRRRAAEDRADKLRDGIAEILSVRPASPNWMRKKLQRLFDSTDLSDGDFECAITEVKQ